MSGAGGGLFGTSGGSFFKAPGWVDLKKPPGTTPQTPAPWAGWAWKTVTLQSLFYSPNLLWFSCAVLNFTLFGFDVDACTEWQFDWVFQRVWVSFLFMGAYFGFWEVTLYMANWSERKFR
eukprot:gene8471-32728_t